MPEFPIANGFYEDASKTIASQECINCIPQIPQAQALSSAQLTGTPGILQFATAGELSSRGAHEMKGVAYSVNGNMLYSINLDGTTTSIGLISGTGRVSIADNGIQMCIVVPGGDAYIFTAAGGLVLITDSDFISTLGPSEQVTFVDGYFVHFNNSSVASTSPIFFVSNLKDGLAYDALDFATAESDPDDITGIHVSRNQLNVIGSQTIEPFANIGGAGFPFQRIQGAVVPKGVKGKFSLVEFNESFAFVGSGFNEQPSVWMFIGSSGQKISTQAIDNVIQGLSDSEQKEIFTTVYSENGGFFLNVHTNDRVLTFDSAASQLSGSPKWHERRSKDQFGRDIIWRVNNIVNAYGKTLVTDSQDGSIGELRRDIFTEYSVSIKRTFSLMPFQAEGESVTVSEMELTMESGVGLTEKAQNVFPLKFPVIFGDGSLNSGSNPQVTRSYSDNGGQTFGNEVSRSMGKQGEFNKRQIWRRDGQFQRFRVYRFTVDEPVKFVAIKLNADLILDLA
jgi:hypothetical protein